MAANVNLPSKIFYIFPILGYFSIFVCSQALEKPQLIPALREIILNPHDDFELECRGNTSLIWNYTTYFNEETHPFSTGTNITTVTKKLPPNNQFKYSNKIIIKNIMFPYTGYLTCYGTVGPRHQNVDETNFVQMYLFVDDSEHLAPIVYDDQITLLAVKLGVLRIPCRPTSPFVIVELWTKKEEVFNLVILDKRDNITDTIYTYDKYVGFSTNNTNVHSTDFPEYECRYRYEHSNTSSTLISAAVAFEEHQDSIPAPILTDLSDGQTVIGQRILLKCICYTDSLMNIFWITPVGTFPLKRESELEYLPKAFNDVHFTRRITTSDSTGKYQGQFLDIKKASKLHGGNYTCRIEDLHENINSHTIQVPVYDINEKFIHFDDYNVSNQSVTVGGNVTWVVRIRAHPKANFFWFDNKNKSITNNSKYNIAFQQGIATLQIFNVNIWNHGYYTLKGNSTIQKELTLFLNVSAPPTTEIEKEEYNFLNELTSINCIAVGSPRPKIRWYYSKENSTFEEIQETSSKVDVLNPKFKLTSVLKINATVLGEVRCVANNGIEISNTTGFKITDVKNGFHIYINDPSVYYYENNNTAVAALGASLEMMCGASNYTYNFVEWHFENGIKAKIINANTTFSYQTTLLIPSLSFINSGEYTCNTRKKGQPVSKKINIIVKEPKIPVITSEDFLNLTRKLPGPMKISCHASGIPKPKIAFYKNNEPIQKTNRVYIEEDALTFTETETSDEGMYTCVASNSKGDDSKEAHLIFSNKQESSNLMITIIVIFCLVIVVIIAVVIIIRKSRREAKLRRECFDLQAFKNGAIQSLNPELGLDDQAELLPYDEKWEFPTERLKIGKQLGAGAYGVVMKGLAKGILTDGEDTTVAVKMVKKNADASLIRALISELKIMIHLGNHVNVVNLLGACTTKIEKRELMVIVEFCTFGNIQNYLLKHRLHFINQVDFTGNINFTINEELLQRTYSVGSNQSNPQSPAMKYVSDAVMNSSGYISNAEVTGATMISMLPSYDDDGITFSNNSTQPEWRSNYRGDYKGHVTAISTKDLLVWAYQLSRGMDYLASRKVLHGDLAARNILLADNNVVKICDFGLAKTMYKDDNYKKKADVLLPFKWMAIESIRDRIFSTQSDVWSFGIVLWELFSLGSSPYPGMETYEDLYNKLLEGYRMKSPINAPTSIYNMMLDCWSVQPVDRPSFTKLSERIGSLLEDADRKHYIDINDPYLLMNTKKLESGEEDYLDMLQSPNFENIVTPNYVNDSVRCLPETPTSGYLSMSPNIFSPRPHPKPVFDFNVPISSTLRQSDDSGVEMVPMLSPSTSTIVEKNCVENPDYLKPVIVHNNSECKALLDKLPINNYVNLMNRIK